MSLKLEVGRSYLNRRGNVVKIVHHIEGPLYYPYFGDNFAGYTPNGQFIRGELDHPLNLFTEYNEDS